MCGGAGTRLWPSSRPSRPKQFMPLSGNRSLFQETATRVASLCDNGRLVVVAGVIHRDAILQQLEALGLDAQLILEPEPRDSAPAMAAAAAWTVRQSAEAINIFVASDHHIPDHAAFEAAVRRAAGAAAEGRIVTLGVAPTEPSSAYGYIAAAGPGLAAVTAFVEKPDRPTAERYIREGHLWNSGNFIASAGTLMDELARYAPAVAEAAIAGLPPLPAADAEVAANPGADLRPAVLTLSDGFLAAPRISIDYAVMEKTERASVLAVDFEWSDLGAWDSVAATGEGALGASLFEDSEGCLVRACDGVMVAALGVRDLAIIVERDAVLVCDLARSQEVKAVVERLKRASPRHLDFTGGEEEGLGEGAARFSDWLRLKALPVWSTLGQSANGAFEELLSLDGRRLDAHRRARVQARQIHVFAEAGLSGWAGPVAGAVDRGLAYLDACFLRSDGKVRTLLTPAGESADETAMLYDQAFVLLALASAQRAGGLDCEARALALRDQLLADGPSSGGLREGGDQPWQSNPHMHLLEACLAWEAAGVDPGWAALSDRIVALALERFIDPVHGCLLEFFAQDWSPADGEDGRRVEPGHQFEWAWLLARHARARGSAAGLEAAHRLYAFGRRGVEPVRQVAVDAVETDGLIRSRRARLWPQTEWLKAALILAETDEGADRDQRLADAAVAQRAIWLYLTEDGLWRDKRLEDGGFLDEPAPASSLYHLLGAWMQLKASAPTLGWTGADRVRLD
ncbi:MAG: AGE family epimerase/isomerase [Brevundimonas sp.]|uniref:AGE family epimerase/isomerase n=1 Tax=Brevundimonas sp. TaxID=1871086 RepID=UPI002732DA51|nr:AGE family epimerase/isomerase [Brevundimonas sp.]MDP3406193.1 AGE family epimerase/isomerase [Brevundimonas sp.]